MQHATTTQLRCSRLPIICKCTGMLADGDLPVTHDTTDPTATNGTCVHAACDYLVHSGERPEDISLFASHYEADPDFVGRSTYYAEMYWREHGHLFPEPQTEVPLPLTIGDHDCPGHADVLSVRGKALLDWKSGYRTDVDCVDQLRGYALAACREHGLEEITAVVVWLADQTTQSWTWTHGELEQWAADLAAKLDDPPVYVEGDHCRYCPKFFTCPAQKALMRSTITALAGSSEEGTKIQAADLGRYYSTVQAVERLCEKYRDMLKAAITRDGKVAVDDDHDLELQTQTRQEIDPLTAWPVMTSYVGGAEALAPAVKVSKTKLLQIIADGAPRGQKGKRKDALMAELEAAGAVKEKSFQKLQQVRRTTQ